MSLHLVCILLPALSLVLPAGLLRAGEGIPSAVEATYKLFHPNSTSTCFLVSRGESDPGIYLLTTAHSLDRIPGETAILVLRRLEGEDLWKRQDETIAIREGDRPRWVKHPDLDVAALKLTKPLTLPVKTLPVSRIADAPLLGAEGVETGSGVFILTYPERFEANDAGFPVTRQGVIADYPFLPPQSNRRYLVEFTAFGGDSGGPVLFRDREGRALVVGMVLSRFHHDEKVKMENEERIIRHPLGLGSVVYPQFLLETIEMAAKAAP